MIKIIIGIVAAVVIIGAIVFFNNNTAEVPRDNTQQSSGENNQNTSLRTPSLQDVKRVVISGHKIQGGNLTIPVGTTVVFENKDNFDGIPYKAHTVTTGTIDPTGQSGILGIVPNSGSGVPDGLISEALKENGEYAYTFNEPGTVTFYIAEHPLVAGEGTVTITAAEEKVVSDNKVEEEDGGVGTGKNISVEGVLKKSTPDTNVSVVNYDGNSYSPRIITISEGDTVRFVSSDDSNMWVASNNHPTHTNYPEKSSGDCSGSSFDQCGAGSTFEFTFNSVGTHKYHNHLRASQGGTIIVQ